MSSLKKRLGQVEYNDKSSKLTDEFKEKLSAELTKFKKIADVSFEQQELFKETITCMDYYGFYGQNGFLVLGSDHGTLWRFDSQTRDLVDILKNKSTEDCINSIK